MLSLLDGWFKMDLGEGAFKAVFGFVFVFLGILFIILLFTVLGKIMSAVNKKNANGRKKKKRKHEQKTDDSKSKDEGITPELIAVMTAAIAAIYEEENVDCDFVVRRIKKL